jgi:hypothetical protein
MTATYSDLPFEVRMRILKYRTVTTSTEIISSIKRRVGSTIDVYIKKDDVCKLLSVCEDFKTDMIVYTGNKYDKMYNTINDTMRETFVSKMKKIITATGYAYDESRDAFAHFPFYAEDMITHQSVMSSELFSYSVKLHNKSQYIHVPVKYHDNALLISVGYPTVKKNTKTYMQYNIMVENLQKIYKNKLTIMYIHT